MYGVAAMTDNTSKADVTVHTPDNAGGGTPAAPIEHWSSDDLPQTPGTKLHTSHENTLSTTANVKNQAESSATVVVDTISGKIASGGAGSSLDMNSERDRGLIRSTITRRPRRWAGVNDELKQALTEGIATALGAAVSHVKAGVDAMEAAKVIASLGRTVEAMEGQCQKDEHRAEDHERIDTGKATQAVQLYGRDAPIEGV